MTQIEKIKAEIERLEETECSFATREQRAGFYDALDRIQDFIESLEEEPPKWDDSDMRYDESELLSRFAFYTYKDEPDVLYLSNLFVEESFRNMGIGSKILAAAEKVAETIGAISICVKVKQNSPANAWYRKNGYGYRAYEEDYDWLEKVLEYTKPSPKIRGWVARDSRGVLEFFEFKPYLHKCSDGRKLWSADVGFGIVIPELYPELTLENRPIEVELTIRKV